MAQRNTRCFQSVVNAARHSVLTESGRCFSANKKKSAYIIQYMKTATTVRLDITD